MSSWNKQMDKVSQDLMRKSLCLCRRLKRLTPKGKSFFCSHLAPFEGTFCDDSRKSMEKSAKHQRTKNIFAYPLLPRHLQLTSERSPPCSYELSRSYGEVGTPQLCNHRIACRWAKMTKTVHLRSAAAEWTTFFAHLRLKEWVLGEIKLKYGFTLAQNDLATLCSVPWRWENWLAYPCRPILLHSIPPSKLVRHKSQSSELPPGVAWIRSRLRRRPGTFCSKFSRSSELHWNFGSSKVIIEIRNTPWRKGLKRFLPPLFLDTQDFLCLLSKGFYY